MVLVQPMPAAQLRLAPGVRVLLRGNNALQFGLDATRSGVIETPLAGKLRPVLASLSTPRPREEVVAALSGCSMTASAALSLVDELLSYRVLVVEEAPALLMFGSGALYDAVSALMRASNVAVRTPLQSEPVHRTLSTAPTSAAGCPVAYVDDLSHRLDAAKVLRDSGRPVLPVYTVDARVFIGPLSLGRPGPCLQCAHLYDLQRDARWEFLTREFDARPAEPNPTTVAAGAAAASVVLRRLCGVADPPGVSAPPPRRGDVLIADPFGPHALTRSRLAPHPRCRLCF